ncbi:YraN family protein [Butyrivibrio proteoclasticus]|uniref:YraN family protein n=1 Tax=Butyrivibrio proteoclasticus TaxID=43305 RepID=UPI00047CC897|nr:YraN family protein [Butyrivibrio proteoclasticus]
MNKRISGSFYEDLACDYIVKNKGRILERNFRLRQGEIDIIAQDEGYICFIEVKYRKDNRYGGPLAAVSFAKIRQICKISRFYLSFRNISEDTPIRYDVIAISNEESATTIRWIKNAFDYS